MKRSTSLSALPILLSSTLLLTLASSSALTGCLPTEPGSSQEVVYLEELEESTDQDDATDDRPERREIPEVPDDPWYADDYPTDVLYPRERVLWHLPNRCQGTAHPDTYQRDFEMPPIDENERGPRTRSDILERFGGSFPPHGGFAFFADPSLRAGTKKPYHLWAEEPKDITLHFHVWFREDGKHQGTNQFAAFVDYKQVPARFIRWNDERTEILEQTHGLSFRFEGDRDKDIEIVDVIFPRELFSEKRLYELGFAYDSRGPYHSQIGGNGFYFRHELHLGSHQRSNEFSCFEPPLGQEAAPIEKAYSRALSRQDPLFLIPNLPLTPVESFEPIPAEPGQTVELFVSLEHCNIQGTEGPAENLIAIPMLNGQAIGQPWYLTAGACARTRNHREARIDARKSFLVTIPEEPGIYDVVVGSWSGALRSAYTLEPYVRGGFVRVDGVRRGDGMYGGSNMLRFVVEEP